VKGSPNSRRFAPIPLDKTDAVLDADCTQLSVSISPDAVQKEMGWELAKGNVNGGAMAPQRD
jgi:hypothetical protein